MGLRCSSAKQGITFHSQCKGSNISLNSCLHQARRGFSFHDGLVFSNRPLLPREKVRIRILEEEKRWYGALRVGFTTENPNMLNANALPQFACPDLNDVPGFWARGIPEEWCQKGAELCFWINRKGQVMYKVWGSSRPKVLFSGLQKRTPFWVVLDVYGRTKSIQLFNHKSRQMEPPCACHHHDKEHHETSTSNSSSLMLDKTPECLYPSDQSPYDSMDHYPEAMFPLHYQEVDPACVICQDRLSDTLLLPCEHCCFCEPCALKVKRQNSCCPLCRQTISCMQNVGALHLSHNLGS